MSQIEDWIRNKKINKENKIIFVLKIDQFHLRQIQIFKVDIFKYHQCLRNVCGELNKEMKLRGEVLDQNPFKGET